MKQRSIHNLRLYLIAMLLLIFFIALNQYLLPSNAISAERINKPKLEYQQVCEHVPGEVLVILRKGMSSKEVDKLFGRHGFEKTSYHRVVDPFPLYCVRFSESSMSIKSVIRNFLSDDEVVSADPNYIKTCDSANSVITPTNDPELKRQWALWPRSGGENDLWAPGGINAFGAWERSSLAEKTNVIVAVIDSGVDTTHPDLQQALIPGHNFEGNNNNENVTDEFHHGTHVAGIIAATSNNGVGIAGTVGPNFVGNTDNQSVNNQYIKIMPVKVMDSRGDVTTKDEVEGIIWAADNGANIINMSFSGLSGEPEEEAAINYAHEKNCILVASAGNSGSNVEYPARYENVIAVGANDQLGDVCDFSCRGEGLDLVAPGIDIYSTIPNENYELKHGTSMSAPHVSAVAAMVRSVRPDFSPDQVEVCIINTAYKPSSYNINDYGAGILDAYEAMDRALHPNITNVVSQWYFPEGCTRSGFEEWICIQNADSAIANVGIEYMTPNGISFYDSFTIPAQSRQTIAVHNEVPEMDVSASVFSDRKIYAERSMYWSGRREGHVCHGLKESQNTWYLAEGCVGRESGFHTYILLQNPNTEATDVNVVFQTNEGQVKGPSLHMPRKSRATIHVNDHLPPNTDVSTMVTSTIPILAERTMYWNIPPGGGPKDAYGGSSSLGVPKGSVEWFCAEGCTSLPFDTWVLIQNPNNKAVEINLTYMTPEGEKKIRPFDIPANSRMSIHVNNSDQMPDKDVSTYVKSNGEVIVERSMYWNSTSILGPGHSSEGVPGEDKAKTWYLAEGCTTWGFETWVLIQNPNDKSANVDVQYMTPNGAVDGLKVKLGPYSRKTINVEDDAPNTDVSTAVTSDTPVIAERAMYWKNRQGGTSSPGICENKTPNTPAGTGVWVILPEGEVTFEEVSSSGTTVFVTTPEAPGGLPPLGYLNVEGQYYYLATTAKIRGKVDVELKYGNIPSNVSESDIRLLYYNESTTGKSGNSTPQWSDITTGVDTQRKVVKGTAPGTGVFCICVPLRVNFDPDTLNKKSQGRWVTTYITLPGGFDVKNIDIKKVRLCHDDQSVPSAWGEKQDDGSLMIKFDREAVASILPLGDRVQVLITGNYSDIPFIGEDYIRVISK